MEEVGADVTGRSEPEALEGTDTEDVSESSSLRFPRFSSFDIQRRAVAEEAVDVCSPESQRKGAV